MKRPNLKEAKVVLSNNDVLALHNDLMGAKDIKGSKLVYAISRSITKLKPVVDALSMDKCIPETEEYKKYKEEGEELAKKYSKGKTSIRNGQMIHHFPWFDKPDNPLKDEFEKQSETLQKKHKKAIDERNKDLKEYYEFLNEPFSEPIENYFHQVDEGVLKDSQVNEGLRLALSFLIK